ncbi:Calponin-3 [Rhizophlyctis rosea]|uniref:Calponin-3 n=1 Tax=Rhizophlyctis rosea TaxID=64517 RepID=A0AAD5X0T6_9FUNG|nr:Calponin-3 [Rhizophlyctis rosea]
MASEIPIYGLDKELADRAAAKFSPEREAQARQWLEDVSGTPFPADSFHESLKDGVIICEAINKIVPLAGLPPIKIAKSKMPFKQMENIHNFLERMKALGVPSYETFQTVDLFEAKNINQVIDSIFALSRNAEKHGFNGPRLGPKLAQKTERTFSEDQLAQGRAAVPLLQSFTGGASQAGMGAMGGSRQVYNPSVDKGDTTVQSRLLGIQMESKGALGVSFGGRREIGGKYLEGEEGAAQPTEE